MMPGLIPLIHSKSSVSGVNKSTSSTSASKSKVDDILKRFNGDQMCERKDGGKTVKIKIDFK